MTGKALIQDLIQKALGQLGLPTDSSFLVEHPADMSHGDYASNVAMVLAKTVGKAPQALAAEIAASIVSPEIESVSVAGPGFLNFKLSQEFVRKNISEVEVQGDSFGKSSIHSGKKILVEHSSPNLFKPFHIGHMMNNAIGESLVRMMKYSGADVRTMSFPSDISLGIAKAIFVLLEENGPDFIPTDIAVLGDAYVHGTKRYDEDDSIHARVKEIADNLYAETPSPELTVFNLCKAFNIAYFEEITARLGSHFDSYVFESTAGVVGKEIVLSHTPDVFTESEGAVVYIPEEEKKALNTAVFINSQGNPTYEAKDVGLLSIKFNQENPDISIFVTDYQQAPHFAVVMDATEKFEPSWSEKSVHIPHGRMTFRGQKMSSRLGGVPLASEMIETVVAEVLEKSEDRESAINPDEVAIAAIKFAILRAKPGQNINFDPDTSLSFEGDSGPYLQYTHARINTLIEKGKAVGFEPKLSQAEAIEDIERVLLKFPDIVQSAIIDYGPQQIVTYLLETARTFNSFYGANKIIDTENPEMSAHRLAVARAVGIVLKNGLSLLGIQAPERM
jgi:arginyl-tRNA synthetase